VVRLAVLEAEYAWSFRWDWYVLVEWLVLGLTALLLTTLLLGLLNSILSGYLHGKLERRRHWPHKRKAVKKEGMVPLKLRTKWQKFREKRIDKPVRSPWVWVIGYLVASAILVVAVPIALIRPDTPWLIVYAFFTALAALCFYGHRDHTPGGTASHTSGAGKQHSSAARRGRRASPPATKLVVNSQGWWRQP
jgi:hypothetical protein